MDLLLSSHATIAPHVQQITLALDEGHALMPEAVFTRIGTLYALQSIIFKGLLFRSTHDSLRMQNAVGILGSLTKLTSLELSNLKFDSFRRLRDVVAACRGLERLYMDTIVQNYAHPDLPDAEPTASPCPPLKLLKTYKSQFNNDLFDWAGGAVSSLCLGTLCIAFTTVLEEQPALGRLLRALGPSLRELAIHSYTGIRHEQSELHIQQCCILI